MSTFGHVYSITCVPTRQVYIGQTIRWPEARWREHLDLLRRGRHGNKNLQGLYKIYGVDGFLFQEIAQVPLDDLDEAEFAAFHKVPSRMLLNIHRNKANQRAVRVITQKKQAQRDNTEWIVDGVGVLTTLQIQAQYGWSYKKILDRSRCGAHNPSIRKVCGSLIG